MSAINSDYAQWLRSDGLITSVVPPGAGWWAEQGVVSSRPSPFSDAAAAQAEANRRAALWGKPLAQDRVAVPGLRSDLIGRCVSLPGGELVIVIAVQEAENDTTSLTILRQLV